MPTPNSAAMDFLLTRRSRPAKTLTTPAPSRAELEPILTAAARTPDHGKLEPWRFIVLGPETMERLQAATLTRAAELDMGEDKAAKGASYFTGPMVIAVIESPKDSASIPAIEQTYSAGAACLALLNAALASGWGANWLTGWVAFDRPLVETHLGLAPHENIAGLIHIGTETRQPPDRPRPDLEQITDWRP